MEKMRNAYKDLIENLKRKDKFLDQQVQRKVLIKRIIIK